MVVTYKDILLTLTTWFLRYFGDGYYKNILLIIMVFSSPSFNGGNKWTFHRNNSGQSKIDTS